MAVMLSQCAAFHLMVKVVDKWGYAYEIWYAYRLLMCLNVLFQS